MVARADRDLLSPNDPANSSPILIVPYMWIGDFVRCHSVVKLLNARWPHRPVDVLTTELTLPLLDYMPGVREGIVSDLPRRALAIRKQLRLARTLQEKGYGTVLVMPRTWKSALAPYLAGIPERIGYVGEARFFVLNDARWGERRMPRMVDQCAALALPPHAILPSAWPAPELHVPAEELHAWRAREGIGAAPSVALAPGAVGASKRWPVDRYGAVARELAGQGIEVWILGGPNEKPIAQEITSACGGQARDLTGTDLRQAVLGLAAATAVVSNDSGLLHVAAAVGTPAIGIFGPTDPHLWGPLNPVASIVQSETFVGCRPCHAPVCKVQHHRCMRDIPVRQVLSALSAALKTPGPVATTQSPPPSSFSSAEQRAT